MVVDRYCFTLSHFLNSTVVIWSDASLRLHSLTHQPAFHLHVAIYFWMLERLLYNFKKIFI